MSLILKDEALKKRVMTEGPEVKEEGHENEYQDFKKLVKKQHCGEWEDEKDIKAAILQKLPEWNERTDLKGWVRADEATSPEVMNELARLSSENHILREQVNSSEGMYDGLTFQQMVKLLSTEELSPKLSQQLSEAKLEYSKNAGLLFDKFMDKFAMGSEMSFGKGDLFPVSVYPDTFIKHHLVERKGTFYHLTEVGRRLRNRLLLYGDREKRYRELWHTEDSQTSSSES